MNDQTQRQPPQLANLANVYDEMADLITLTDDQKSQIATLESQLQLTERRADLADAENERLRRQIHQMKGEVNHYFRSSAEADNTITAIAALVVQRQRAIEEAADRANRRRESTQPRRQQAPLAPVDDGEAIPKFLHTKFADEHPPIRGFNRIVDVIRAGAASVGNG